MLGLVCIIVPRVYGKLAKYFESIDLSNPQCDKETKLIGPIHSSRENEN